MIDRGQTGRRTDRMREKERERGRWCDRDIGLEGDSHRAQFEDVNIPDCKRNKTHFKYFSFMFSICM